MAQSCFAWPKLASMRNSIHMQDTADGPSSKDWPIKVTNPPTSVVLVNEHLCLAITHEATQGNLRTGMCACTTHWQPSGQLKTKAKGQSASLPQPLLETAQGGKPHRC
uniref:Uncharacterized protein n=1 Tax=Eutreptiella gymnastica TaxID=73025 RepID=A0A7S1N702_9EUGL|mmetsp:Transcript_131262/g.227219  ORF Transcript_131262/g.227219 Transcript_131262/m.227219 type:complete len:108 (+) Transcript_131262:105-428(+)